MSPRSEAQNEQLREASRIRILETALDLFARQGYAATSIRMITQTAGIAQGLIYRYFESKEDLLATIVQESMQDVRATFVLAEQAQNPADQIEQLIRAAFATVQQRQLFWKLQYSLRMQNTSIPGLDQALTSSSYEILGMIEAFFAAAGVAQPKIEAALLFGQIDGVAQHYVLNPDQYPLGAVTEAMVARYRAIVAD